MGVRERSEPESHLAIEGHHASLRDARVRGVQDLRDGLLSFPNIRTPHPG
jgi:hypothetical protein